MKRLWDISPPLVPGIPVWPGDQAYREIRTATIGPGSPVNVSAIAISTHTGAHVDAPFHFAEDGATVGAVDLAPYLGPARVVDLRGVRRVEPGHLAAALADPACPPRILLRTCAQAPAGPWDPDFAVVSPEAVAAIARRGCILVGVDTPSLDPETSETLDVHLAAHRHGLAILEGLVLAEAPAGDYELIALPLKLMNLDASPVRAVLREL